MRLGLILFLFPIIAWAYVSPIVAPKDGHEVIALSDVQVSRVLFGVLNSFPHTYEFTVNEPSAFKAVIAVHDTEGQANDASIILVKEERRGVSEIGRTQGKKENWQISHDRVLVESFRTGGTIESQLQSGTYVLEVSSPNNDAAYQLTLGVEDQHNGYFSSVRTLFAVKHLFGSSYFTALLSPLLYVPFAVLCLCGLILLYWRRTRQL